MRNKKKALLSLAVAHASMALAMDASAIDYPITSEADDGAVGTLRHAIANAVDGDTITIDADVVETITLESALVTDQALIISAAVDDDGRPQVTIEADDDDYRLLTLADAGGDPIPFVISGLEFSGAHHGGNGGAILAENHALILDKSTVSGNIAYGAGGGVAVERGELCLQGSEISGNTVLEGYNNPEIGMYSYYAIGGGAAVNGIANVLPSTNDDQNCLTSEEAETLFDTAGVDFADDAAALAGNPDGVEIIASEISGNSALVDEPYSYFYDAKYVAVALGGGLAILEADFEQQESALLGSSCESVFGDNEDLQCSSIVGATITENTATVALDLDFGATKYSVASGGGVFIGSPAFEVGQLVAIKYSDVSDNSVTLEGSGSSDHDVAVGGGVGALAGNMVFGMSEFWDELTTPDEAIECSGDSPYETCGNNIILGASTVTGNMLNLDLDASEYGEGGARDIVAGGGIGSLNMFDEGLIPDEKYDLMPQVMSFMSSISGNSLTSTASEEFLSATGGGVSVGTIQTNLGGGGGGQEDLVLVEPTQQQFGKYSGVFSGNSGNEVVVTGAGDMQSTIGGGGVSAPFMGIFGNKPEFAIISDEEPEDKYGLTLSDALFTSPGGISDNIVDATNTSGEMFALIGGGGAFTNAKYSFTQGRGALITGNQVMVNATGAEGFVAAAGGGAAQVPVLMVGEALAAWKYSEVSNNSVTVSGDDSLQVGAFGGGLALSNDFSGEGGPGAAGLSLEGSEISGNSIAVTSAHGGSWALGGGVSVSELEKYIGPPGDPDILNTTIAGNSLSLAGGGGEEGSVLGAGLYIYGDGETGGIVNATIANNTGSFGGAPDGGQVFLDVDSTGYDLINTLISGDVAQGDQDLYYTADVDAVATAVFHDAVAPIAGFADPALADPAFLDVLQFNGSNPAGGEGKYGFIPATATIALLPGSGAIDPDDGGCISDGSTSNDQRDYPRDDGCVDLGAYEFMAERDGDSLVDDAELGAAGTNEDILAELMSYPAPYGIVLESGDGNSDGFPDVDQAHVASFTHDTAGALTLFVSDSDGYDLANVTQMPGMMAGGYDLSLGGVSFTVLTGDDTETVELSLIVAASANELSLVKQECHPDDLPAGPDDGWVVLDDSPEPFGGDRVIFTFELEPNGPFDCNGAAPDILDPVYIAQEEPLNPAAPDGGGREAPVPVPAMPAFLYVLLSGAMAAFGLQGMRSRRRKAAK